MLDDELAYLTPEAKARVVIDRKLADAVWAVQDARAVGPLHRGVAESLGSRASGENGSRT